MIWALVLQVLFNQTDKSWPKGTIETARAPVIRRCGDEKKAFSLSEGKGRRYLTAIGNSEYPYMPQQILEHPYMPKERVAVT